MLRIEDPAMLHIEEEMLSHIEEEMLHIEEVVLHFENQLFEYKNSDRNLGSKLNIQMCQANEYVCCKFYLLLPF